MTRQHIPINHSPFYGFYQFFHNKKDHHSQLMKDSKKLFIKWYLHPHLLSSRFMKSLHDGPIIVVKCPIWYGLPQIPFSLIAITIFIYQSTVSMKFIHEEISDIISLILIIDLSKTCLIALTPLPDVNGIFVYDHWTEFL